MDTGPEDGLMPSGTAPRTKVGRPPTIPSQLHHDNLRHVVAEKLHHAAEELVVGHAGDGTVLEVGLVREVLADLAVREGGPELKVPRAQGEHALEGVLLRDGEAAHDVGRQRRDRGARHGVGDLGEDARVLRVVGEERPHDGAAGVLQDDGAVLHAVHADVVRGGEDELPEGAVFLGRAWAAVSASWAHHPCVCHIYAGRCV